MLCNRLRKISSVFHCAKIGIEIGLQSRSFIRPFGRRSLRQAGWINAASVLGIMFPCVPGDSCALDPSNTGERHWEGFQSDKH